MGVMRDQPPPHSPISAAFSELDQATADIALHARELLLASDDLSRARAIASIRLSAEGILQWSDQLAIASSGRWVTPSSG